MKKLETAGIVSKTDDRYRTVPIAAAQAELDRLWQSYTQTSEA
ncbi:MAG: hypothetical protein U0792_06335 [Gemmataceae bacterium]